ncbi:MAG: S-layer homology domain-containing protein [Bacillota bacterium]|nr:S-layer homology domain-containing protein [Bacillota bacterium]
MNRLKRTLCIIISILTLLLQGIFPQMSKVYAVTPDITPQEPPEKVRIEAKDANEPPIGYNEFDNYYADLKWDQVTYPDDAVAGYVNINLLEINKPYKPAATTELKERDLPGGTTQMRLKDLKSGTIYNATLTAYHTHTDGKTTYNSALSVPSNNVKFMTNINLMASSYGVNQLKIEWDDVWNSGRRIDYKLYISENPDFSNIQPIYIGQEQIEPLGPIKVNQVSGRLEYLYTVNDPGRVYYIKIVPDVTEAALKKTDESGVVMASSFIIARTSKVSENETGDIWRFDWSPVVSGLSSTDINISYQIYRGDNDSNDVPQYMASVDDTNFFVTTGTDDKNYYYLIVASVTKNGKDVYPGMKIKSDKILLLEHDVISIPIAPEITDIFERVPGDTIISYKNELKPNSATVLWKVPRKGDGSVDTDISYDIWLIDNPNALDNPTDTYKLAYDFKPTADNYIVNGTEIKGYKYTAPNLTANSTYYFKIIAKKSFVDYVDDKLKNVISKSDPSVKVIITPSDGPIDQPKVPSRPPFKLKKDSEGNPEIGSTTVTVSLKNKWYEKFDDAEGKWEFIRTEKTSATDVPPYIPSADTLDGKNYRVVEYDSGVTIDVGCVEYIDGMSYKDIANITANHITGFPVTANDEAENSKFNPDGLSHNINITLTNLIPNTTYIIWLRAERKSVNFISGPSDPIVITTEPEIKPPIVKPTVPIFNYGLSGDTFVDLGWNFNSNYKYTLKYGTVENINSATGSVQINPEDFANSNFYKVNNLTQDTAYFFWVQAETLTGGSKSEWSDSYSLKTLPFSPPETPAGFGIKNGEASITKDSITFEWAKVDGLEYKLEIALDTNYKNLTEYKCGAVSEYKVDSLKSNFRYYARLYAYDSKKQMYSEPTQSITIRTERSDDDYDSDQDIENILKGDYVITEPRLINNIWNISITGPNADRFIEHMQTDKVIDYKIDLTKPPSKTNKLNINIGGKVLDALSSLKENLIISADSNTDGKLQFVIGPETLNEGTRGSLSKKLGEINYALSIGFTGDNIKTEASNLVFKTNDVAIGMNASGKGAQIAVQKFDKPMKIVFPYYDEQWYHEGKTSGYTYDTQNMKWNKLSTTAKFNKDDDKGFVSIEALTAGNVAVAEAGNNYYDDISGNWAESSINNVASICNLKSIPGRLFNPDKNISVGETVKLMLDIMNVDYDNEYMVTAAKAQLITTDDVSKPDENCSKEKTIAMISRLYEIKTGKSGKLSNISKTGFMDLNKVSTRYLPQINFAIQNGIVIGNDKNYLSPSGNVTRAEVISMIEKLLVLTGEL